MNPHRKQHLGMKSLIGVLLVGTLLWGTAVAAHHHIGVDHEVCNVCLLPTAASVAPAAAQIAIAAHHQMFLERLPASHIATPIQAYQGRAPPR